MWPRIRTVTIMLLLGVLTTAASVFVIAYWPRTLNPTREQIDRDRRPEAGEGRGFLSLRYESGIGFRHASGWASQQFIIGGYNYATNTAELSWPDSVERRAVPWLSGAEPWPADGVSRQVRVLRLGWPLPMLEGAWTQTLKPRPPPPGRPRMPIDEDPDNPTNVVATTDWQETRTMWSAYGGLAYMNAPAWLKGSRLGEMVFNKSQLPAIPTRPLWLGLVVNVLFFSAAWWGLVALTHRVRRAIRAARSAGRCEWCRYSRAGLGPDAPCPECGKRPGRDSNPRPAV